MLWWWPVARRSEIKRLCWRTGPQGHGSEAARRLVPYEPNLHCRGRRRERCCRFELLADELHTVATLPEDRWCLALSRRTCAGVTTPNTL